MSDHPETCEKCGHKWGWCVCPVTLIYQDELAALKARLADAESLLRGALAGLHPSNGAEIEAYFDIADEGTP